MKQSETILCVVIIFLVFIILTDNHKKLYEFMTSDKIESTIDKRYYKISNAFINGGEAADKLAYLNEYIIKFLKYIKKKYIIENHNDIVIKGFYVRMLNNYNMDVIFENNPKEGEETSFVTDKGAEFGICLREKNNKNIHDDNILQFVMLHELTHLGCIEYGHGNEFWTMFKVVLNDAVEAGLHKPIDYSKNNINYCGLPVNHNPYFS